MKIVYSHNRLYKQHYDSFNDYFYDEILPKGGITIAIEAIPSYLLDTLKYGDTIVKKVGVARCSTEDNFCKKTGRELAESRLKSTTLTVRTVLKDEGFCYVVFEDENGNVFQATPSKDIYCSKILVLK